MPVNRTIVLQFSQIFQFDLMAPGVYKAEGDGFKLKFYALPNVIFASKELGVTDKDLERKGLEAACQLAAELCEIAVSSFSNPHYVYPGPYIVVEVKVIPIDKDLVMKNWNKLPKSTQLW